MPSVPVSCWRGTALRNTRPVSLVRILVGRERSTCDSSVSAVTFANPGVPNPRPSYQSMCPAPALLRGPRSRLPATGEVGSGSLPLGKFLIHLELYSLPCCPNCPQI